MDCYVIEAYNGYDWEVDCVIHTPALAHKHRKELIADCGFTAREVRIVAFIEGVGGDASGAADFWEASRREGKVLGLKAMAKLKAQFNLTAVGFLSAKESVSFSVGGLPV